MQTDMDMHHRSAKDGPQVGQGQQIEEYDNMILLQYKSKLSPLMHNHGHHSSHLLISRQSSTNQLTQPDQLHYFKLGRERDRLKNYVQRQLDSEQTRTNQKILMRFQQEAALRRHHYLPKFVYETYEAENSRQKVDMRYQKAEMVPRINHQTVLPCNIIAYKSKFSSYIPGEYEIRREYRSPPLVATQKTKPPVYNYYNVLPHRNFDQYAPPNYNQHCKTVELPKKKTQVTTQKYLLKVAPQHSRAMSMQIDPAPVENNHVWALKKIKQAVIRKRQQRSKEREDTACSSGSSLVSRLERRRAQKMGECGQLTKHLRKLKKYRRIIAQQSKKRGEQ